MDYLKSAVASAISKGPPFPYTFGDRVDVDHSIWTLHNGTKREDGSNCSIFSFDVANRRSSLPLARNTVRKLRTLRHPGVVKVLDTVETESYIYIAAERLTPLGWHVRRKDLSAETLKWGLYSVAKTLKFVNDDAASVHGNFRVSSIFISESGEWKLGGFETLSALKDEDAIIYSPLASLVPDSARYAPPESASSGNPSMKSNTVSAMDAYDLGILIFEVFNGSFTGREQAGQTKGVPPSMHQSYKRLVISNPKTRLSVGHFLEQGKKSGGFFETPLIKLTEGVESLGVKNDQERAEFLNELDGLSDDFPEEFFKMKVLPELLKSLEFGGGGAKVFGAVMKIAAKLSDDEFSNRITPVIVRLFASPDRATRVYLLDSLPIVIDRLPQKIVNDKIFPQLVSGFTDVAPVIREQTVKSVLTIVPKLSDRIINGELLKYLAKTANDDQPGIRTNTTICLGKIAKNLGSNTRTKVLTAAFARSLRDPFVHARNAALMALAATSEYFSEDDCACKLMPAICPSLVDKEKIVRDQANKTLDFYLHRIRKFATDLPESALPPINSADGAGAAIPRMGTPQSDTSWAGWAVSSFTNKLAAASGDIQSGSRLNATQPSRPRDPRSTSAPPASDGTRPSMTMASASASTLHRQALASPALTTSSSTHSTPDFFHDTPDDDNNNNDEDTGIDAWGDMDDIGDDNDDNDEQNPFGTTSKRAPPSPKAAYDDGGEPDFAGWLAAQAQSKAKNAKNPLPKGLAKKSTVSSTDRPTAAAARTATTGSIGLKKTTASGAVTSAQSKPQPKSKPASKQIDTKPKEEGNDDDDGWGDGWD
ncbi:MAG: hypothetical protein M1825_006322 [Sarcosagium campestre]|nr:MAG: hypothetical protein M1825_006322 [Sarcosagium campestre]